MEGVKRKKRWEAVPSDVKVDDTPQLRLLVLGLAKHGHLNSSHIERLTGWSREYRKSRMRELFDRGIVKKVKTHVLGRHDIFYLNKKGIQLAKHWGSWENLYLSRAERAVYLDHKVTHAGNMVGFERSCIDTPSVRFIDTSEIRDNNPEFKGKIGWEVDVYWKGEVHRLGVNPDSLAGFQFLEAPEGKNKLHFVVETDLSSENEVRTNWHDDQSSVLKMLICYLETREQGILESLFGIKKFKVLTIVNDEARIERIIRKCPDKEPRLLNPMFLFNTHEAVQKGNVLQIPWTDMWGNKGRIMT